MISPYWNNTFWEFFATLAQRLFRFEGPLAADEVQVLVLSCIALSCAFLGPFLVLKRMTMLANSLSHTILLGLSLSFMISRPLAGLDLPHLLLGALAAGLLTVFLTSGLSRVFRLQEDASVGLVFTSLFALGIVFVTVFTRDVHLGVEAVMGNADALGLVDLKLAALLALINGAIVLLFFWQIQLATFDRPLAQALRVPCGLIQSLLLFLVAATCIGAFRAVGVLLVLSFLVGPFLIARLFSHRLGPLLALTASFGVGASLLGVALARHLLTAYGLALSTGGIVSTLIALLYVGAVVCKKFKRKPAFFRS